MTLPGRRWRVLAQERAGRSVDVRNAGQFDELVVDGWLHIEQMNDRHYWMGLGPLHINVRLDADGTARIRIARDHATKSVVVVEDGTAGESDGPTWEGQ